MQRRLDLAAIRRIAAPGRRIVGAAQLDDLAGGVLDHLGAGDEIGVTKADLAAWSQAEELLRRIFHEVVALDEDFAAERDAPGAERGVVGMVGHLHLLGLAVRVIGQHELQRAHHRHRARRAAVQVLAHAVLEQADVDDVFLLGDADARAEVADRFRRVAAAAQA